MGKSGGGGLGWHRLWCRRGNWGWGKGLGAARRGVRGEGRERGKGGEVAKEKRKEEKSQTQNRWAESTQSKSLLRRESSESE